MTDASRGTLPATLVDITGAPYRAPTNGVDDARAAFAMADTVSGSPVAPPGVYRISSNITLTKPWQFMQGAKLRPAPGVTVTFAGPFIAGLYEIFDLADGGSVVFEPGAVERVHPVWWGAKADGATNDFAALTAAFSAARAAHAAVQLLDAEYVVKATLDIANVPIFGNAIITRDDSANLPVVSSTGTCGSYAALDADATKSTNVVTCAAMASQVERGTLVVVTSDKDFSVDEPGVKQGEMVTVRFVSGSNIYFDRALNDTYLVSDGAKMAIISPAIVDVRGKLTIRAKPATPASETRGADFTWCYRPRGVFEFDRCTRHAMLLMGCYEGDLWVFARDSAYTDTNNSYGVAIAGPTMYTRIRGVVAGARHAVMHGGSPGIPGVPWWNPVTVIGQGAGGSASSRVTFDAHAACGAAVFDNCIALCGEMTDESLTTLRTSGFVLGARYNYIRNGKTQGAYVAVSVRGSSSSVIEVVDIDGLVHEDGFLHAVNIQVADSPTIRKLRVKHVSGNVTGTGAAALAFQGGAIEDWEFDDIKLRGARLITASNTAILPSVFKISNSRSVRGDGTVTAAVDINSPNITQVRLYDVENDGADEFLNIGSSNAPLDLVELIGCNSKGVSVRHIDSAVAVGTIRVLGGAFENGTVIMRALANITNAEIAPSRVNGPVTAVAGSGSPTVDKIKIGGATGTITNLYTGLGNTPLEVVSGSFDIPRVLRGTGAPSFAAPIGTQYQRADGGAGTSLYVNETGGSGGWAAK